MSKKQQSQPPVQTTEKRFPKAAVDYIDALLEVQRARFEREQALMPQAEANWPALPSVLELVAEGDNFVGSGWGALAHNKKGVAHRWMARIGTLLLPVDASKGGTIKLTGGGYLRRRFVNDLTVWLDDQPVVGVAVRKGLNGWVFEGAAPKVTAGPFHILRLQTSGLRAFAQGPGAHASLALSAVSFKAGS